MNDEPNIEPIDLSPTRAELIARVRARGRRIRARRRAGMSVLAALVVVAIAVPAVALGSRTTSHSITPATAARRPGDFRVAQVLRLQQHGEPCVRSFDGKLCYVLGRTVMTARDVVSDQVLHDSTQGWIVNLRVTPAGGRRLKTLTNEQAAIVVGGRVISAPTVNPGIIGTTITVSGDLSHAQAKRLASLILGGSTPPATTVTESIELPGNRFVAGQQVHGTLVIDNETDAPWPYPTDLHGCESPFAIVLTNATVPPDAVFTQSCIARTGAARTLPIGVTRIPFTMLTSFWDCTGSRPIPPGDRACLPNGRIPTLPPGGYTAVLYGGDWPQPPGVPITLIG